MSTPMLELDDIIERVRLVIADAEGQGLPRPGRPTLMELTGLSEHQVRKAQDALKEAEEQAPSPGDSSESPAAPNEDPGTKEMPAVNDHEPVEPQEAGEPLEMPDLQANPTGDRGGESRLQQPRGRFAALLGGVQWPLLVIGLGAAVAVWSGWVGLGQMTGFGPITPLPGIADDLRINTAVVLPISVEAYSAYALRIWLGATGLTERTRKFAMWSAISSLAIGAGAQIAYHLMAAKGIKQAPWPITMLVACVPVVVLGLAAALAHLVNSDRHTAASAGEEN